MASLIVAGLTVVPLLLLIWDLGRNSRRTTDQFAGPARTPIS
jgi:hypothetical protein